MKIALTCYRTIEVLGRTKETTWPSSLIELKSLWKNCERFWMIAAVLTLALEKYVTIVLLLIMVKSRFNEPLTYMYQR